MASCNGHSGKDVDMEGSEEDDVILKLEGGRLTCKRKALADASPYFLAMFTKGFAETEKEEISLHGIDFDAMKVLVAHLNGRNATHELRESNVMSVLQAAGMLHFEPIRNICCEFIKGILTVKNCLQILCETDILGEVDLHHLALKYVLWNFRMATSVQYLSEVPLYVLKSIIDHPHVNVKAEIVIFDVIKRWIESDYEERAKYANSLISCLKLDCFEPRDLQKISHEGFVKESPDAFKLIDSKMRERSMSIDAISLASFDKSSVSKSRQPPIYPCVVGRLKPQSAVKITDKEALPYLFIFKDGSVEPYLALSKMVNSSVKAQGYQVNSVGPDLFITGGEFILGRSNWNKTIWSYNTMTSSWSYISTMEVARRHHSVCITKQDPEDEIHPYIYLVGGYGRHRIILDQVDRLCLETRVMQECPPLPSQMYCPAVCFFRGKLYVIKVVIYCFDPETCQWSKVDHIDLPKHMDFNCALVSDSYIYLTGNHSYELYRFDPDVMPARKTTDHREIELQFDEEISGGNQSPPAKPSKVDLEFVGRFTNEAQNVCMVKDVIYNFSTEQFDYKSSIETYDLATNTFSLVWEKNTDDFDFSPYYSSGCFPVVLFN